MNTFKYECWLKRSKTRSRVFDIEARLYVTIRWNAFKLNCVDTTMQRVQIWKAFRRVRLFQTHLDASVSAQKLNAFRRACLVQTHRYASINRVFSLFSLIAAFRRVLPAFRSYTGNSMFCNLSREALVFLFLLIRRVGVIVGSEDAVLTHTHTNPLTDVYIYTHPSFK